MKRFGNGRFTAILGSVAAGLALMLQVTTADAARPSGEIGKDWGNPKGHECVECHWQEDPGLTMEWNNSQHGQSGVNCLDCHAAKADDVDGFEHEGQLISIIVTPKDCSKCHSVEFEEMDGSHHSKGGQILASLDNLLGEVVGGPAAVNAGCRQCHGSKIEIGEDGRPLPTTWPNTGIGRINPDGSAGSCTACHGRHRFSKAQARTPDTCGKCHVGPDHPQIEVYNESKHGIIYRAKVDEMNMESDKWVAGVDYSAAPTCATCHMSAGGKEGKTHNVGDRISWTLRPPISQKINLIRLENGNEFDVKEGKKIPKVGDKAKGSTVVEVVTWQERRKKMQEVCKACHSDSVIMGHYNQFDNVVELYNEKFAKPIAAVMGELKKNGYITKAPFDDKIEWTWWEIWHHEGRRARHGASMSGPDYTWWHGIYDVAKHTYMKWIPELKEVSMKKDGNTKFAEAMLDKYFKPIDGHTWYFEGMSKESIDKVRKGFEERYGKGALK
ncbi:MAG: multiheme c-type cytochrome [Candidatus Thiodiazotropha taylori]|uniref:Cytochrome C552 n=1 Tax=Candidatus Thiodiazotropha taylori TaxID=2792791 RepID=A0A9E4T5C8_9GAMM|nr:cytochrome C552 [Candidatus Thiodiazotropha taylori]MCG7963618.1 cytochrome C552 [Candidatus Thiodiazotropha endolucinida]MCG7948810.1 cytochrome C552 [Candidatus Thiodiazotropha taylori]MCG7965643.1 cytochrome C552 [Candidatus Thiodiazotropha taylori]MCG8027973.1 cytochrome C552 [Candidatus Thiodiazotropha taylori]